MTTADSRPTTTDSGIFPSKATNTHSRLVPTDRFSYRITTPLSRWLSESASGYPSVSLTPRAAGASEVFQVTGDVGAYTKAAVFQPGVETDLAARFSTVAGERGSPDTWRDPRGFALSSYTTEGNYDMVGNNTPVFLSATP